MLLLGGLAACVPGAPSSCGYNISRIACENSQPGSPRSEWDGTDDASIGGFVDGFSVNQGEAVRFKVSTDATAYTITIFRFGWYQGLGARRIATVAPAVPLPQVQPACLTDAATGLVDCGNWGVSASWNTTGALSGVYTAVFRRSDNGKLSHAFFVVREDTRTSQVLFQTDDATWQAYNLYGGRSLYGGVFGASRAFKVSYNRPNSTGARFLDDQYPLLRFFERNGYDVTYAAGVDSAQRGATIAQHKVFLSSGHDEYWSADQRANVEAARDAGVNLAFLSGNEVFWKTRWEPSIDGTATPYRTMVCYKETLANAKTDPSPEWTGTWRDPRFSPPADGGRPENALTGTLYRVNGYRSDTIQVPAADGKMRFWRNTLIASLPPTGVATLAARTLGYEWDEAPDDANRPAGLFDLSTTTVTVTDGTYLLDNGSTYGNGTATHHLTMFRAPSGALVFGAGTVQWAWGLDTENLHGGSTPDVRMQQATVNLLADMGAQPTTLMAGLVKASPSSDRTPPTTTITGPVDGAAVIPGAATVISGTASDGGGGRVGGVEVSTDGGATWHPATGRESWTYAWTPTLGSTTIEVRAVDDSGNLQTAPATITVSATEIRSSVGSVVEGNAGTAYLVVPVTLSDSSTQTVTIQWATGSAPGSPAGWADPAVDFTPASGTITFAPGETSKSITIEVIGDTVVEPDETVLITLGHAINARLGVPLGLASGVIVNDD